MSIDRFGNAVRTGWQPHEIEWCAAAITLCVKEREAAYADIASLTGRPISAVRSRGKLLMAQDRQKTREWLALHLRKNWASGEPLEAPRRIWVECPTLSTRSANGLAAAEK